MSKMGRMRKNLTGERLTQGRQLRSRVTGPISLSFIWIRGQLLPCSATGVRDIQWLKISGVTTRPFPWLPVGRRSAIMFISPCTERRVYFTGFRPSPYAYIKCWFRIPRQTHILRNPMCRHPFAADETVAKQRKESFKCLWELACKAPWMPNA